MKNLIKNKKILVIAIALTITLVGGTTNFIKAKLSSNNHYENKTNNSEQIKAKEILNVISSFDYTYDISNNKLLADNSDYIAIIKITSVDGVTNKNRITGTYVAHPYTYGSAEVLKVLKGDLPTNNINYVRMGGKISYDEWLKGDVDPQKIESVRKENGLSNTKTENIIVNYKAADDIDLENGKTYLAYMFHNSSFNYDNEYNIHAVQYGLREIKDNGISTTSINDDNILVKNNTTGKWEKLSEVINLKK